MGIFILKINNEFIYGHVWMVRCGLLYKTGSLGLKAGEYPIESGISCSQALFLRDSLKAGVLNRINLDE